MDLSPSSPQKITVLVTVEPDVSGPVTCPMCHTTHSSLTADALKVGTDWLCARCGQRWDATRLATVGAYGAWALEHDAAARRRATPGNS